MNKYIYSECSADYWPEIKSVIANSLEDAEERVMEKYIEKYDLLSDYSTFETFREALNDKKEIALSDLYDIEIL